VLSVEPYYQDSHVTLYLNDALDLIPTLEPEGITCLMMDPPYSSGGCFRGDRTQQTGSKYSQTKHGTELFTGDNRDQRSFTFWLTMCVRHVWPAMTPGGIVSVFSDWRQLPSVTDVLQAGGYIWRGVGVWDKTQGARPRRGFYRQQAEFIVWGSKGVLGKGPPLCLPGVWSVPYVHASKRVHGAEKPHGLMLDLLRIVAPGGAVLDLFAGSGVTLAAAKSLSLRSIGCEIEERHAETAARRLERTAAGEALPAAAGD
jgi:site-specific DNA-methyltransferase (adenine-specific)